MKKNSLYALGLAASVAATGCDNNKAEPMQVSPETHASAQPAQQPAPQSKSYAPVIEAPKWSMSDKAANYVCDRLEGRIDTGVVLIEDGSFWIADCTKKQVAQILSGCNSNYSGNVANVEGATCSRDADGFRTVDVTSYLDETLDGHTSRRKVVLTGSDRNKIQNMPLNKQWQTKEKYEDATGEDAPMFGAGANIWILHEKTGVTAATTPKPSTVVPVTPVVPPKKEVADNGLERRVGALEKRMDGVEVGLEGVKKRVSAVELMVEDDNHTHDDAEDRLKRGN